MGEPTGSAAAVSGASLRRSSYGRDAGRFIPCLVTEPSPAHVTAADRNHLVIGRPGLVSASRELTVVGTPYYVRRIDRTLVFALRVLRGAQRWPPF
jgi:hypothetical protein